MEIYRKRISEVMFQMIGIEDWDEEWKKRDISALVQSHPTTLLMGELLRVLDAERRAIAMSAPTEIPTITINTYPYNLSKEQSAEMVRELRQQFTGFKVEIGRWCEKGVKPNYA